MKKLVVIPVMVLYLFAVTGIMIHAHYCGQQLESWQMYVKGDDGCVDDTCSDEPAEEEGCCKDEVVSAKVSIDQDVSFFKYKLLQGEWAMLPASHTEYVERTVAYTNYTPVSGQPNAPPGRWQNIPLFKLHSSFTYYG